MVLQKTLRNEIRRMGGRRRIKRALVDELAVLWHAATGKKPSASGDGSFDAPRTDFGRFVRDCVRMLPEYVEFRYGFPDLIRRAVKGFEGEIRPKQS